MEKGLSFAKKGLHGFTSQHKNKVLGTYKRKNSYRDLNNDSSKINSE